MPTTTVGHGGALDADRRDDRRRHLWAHRRVLTAATDTGVPGLLGYNVYRNGAYYRQITAPGISIVDLGVSPSTSYTYGIASVDNAGNESARVLITQSTPACPSSATATAILTRTATPMRTSTAIRTTTPVRTATATPVPLNTATRTATAVRTATRTATPVRTATRTATPVLDGDAGGGGDGGAVERSGSGDGVGCDQVGGDRRAREHRGDGVVHGDGGLRGRGDEHRGVVGRGGGEVHEHGAHVWSKRIGSVGLDAGYGVAIDRSANCDGAGGTDCVLVVGGFGYTVDFDPGPGTANLTTAGAGDVFVAKYSSCGDVSLGEARGRERHELR